MKNYISVNVVPQSLLLLKMINDHNCRSEDEAKQLKLPYGYSYITSSSFAIQCGFLEIDEKSIIITKDGQDIIDDFDGNYIEKQLWRKILSYYISSCQPAWSKRIPYGRAEAIIFMNEEEKRCFSEAELLDNYDKDVIEWWDSIANDERIQSNVIKDDIGRKGEFLTISYEEERTKRRPKWISIDSNLAGYDVLSVVSKDIEKQLLIEVKSSVKPINEARAIITRNEWEIANYKNNLERYVFYLWLIHDDRYKLARVSVKRMSDHIPMDRGEGVWESVSVPFKYFDDCFADAFW